MKIAIVGTGAMGSIYAARLAEAGNEVWAVDAWQAHVDAINANGLRVDGPYGKVLSKSVQATQSISDTELCDLYVVATKASGVAGCARAISDVIGTDSLVLAIQNGLGAESDLAAYLPVRQVMLGVAEGFGASMVGPGHSEHTSMKLIRLGMMNGGPDPRLQDVADVWNAAGFSVEIYEDITQLRWEKLLCNVTLSGPCTVFGCNVAELRAHPERWNVAIGCMKEAYAVGLAIGVHFSFDDPVAYVTDFARRVGTAKPSMLQDHEARRHSELDAINGAIPPLGRQYGVKTPFNETVTAVISALEARFDARG